MNFERLRLLLIASFMLVSLVPLAALGHKIFFQGEQLIKEKASSYLRGLSEKNADSIKWFMAERANDMNLISSIICIFDFDTRLLNNHFHQMKDIYKPYFAFFVLDEAGKPIYSNQKNDSFLSKLPNHIRQPSTPFFNMNISNIFMLEIDEEQIVVPAFMSCKPIMDETANRCGSLCALVDFRIVDSMLRKSNIEVTGEVYLVDKDGLFLTGSRFGAKALVDRISTELIDDNIGFYETIDYRNERVLQAYKRIEPFFWYVISDQDMAEILDRIKGLRKEAVIYGTMTAMIVFCLAFFVSTVIVNILKAKYQYEKELEFQVIQKEKLASLGLLTSGLAHELNTPLANALLYTQIAREEIDDSKTDSATIQTRLSTAEQEIRQGSRIIRNLLEFSRHPETDAKECDVNNTLEKLMNITGPHCTSKKIRVEKKLDKDIPRAKADPSSVQAILTNVIANAIEAMPDGGVLSLTTRYASVLKKIKIEIADSGPGIPENEIINIFNPFFTTKKQGEGTGLGLFVSHEMTRKLGGDIKVISSTGNNSKRSGTLFTVEFSTEPNV